MKGQLLELRDGGTVGYEIPEEWGLWPLKRLSNSCKAGPFGSALITSALLPEGNWLVYTPEHVGEQRFGTTKNLFLPESRIGEMNRFAIKVGDVVFPIVGSLGRAIPITKDMPTEILNQRLAKFRIDEKLLNADYSMWLFCRCEFYSPYIELEQRGSIIVNLTKAIVGEMPVLFLV